MDISREQSFEEYYAVLDALTCYAAASKRQMRHFNLQEKNAREANAARKGLHHAAKALVAFMEIVP